MAEVLATMVVGPLVSMVKDKASSYLLDQYGVMDGMEEQHKLLKRKLPAVLDVITDAEEQAAKNREGAKAWLQDLREVAYKANDVLDEFKYEALRRKAKAEGHYKAFGMDVIKLFPSHNRFVFRHRMANKLCKILQEIDVLITEMNAFRFEFKPQPPMSMKWRQTDPNISDHSLKSIASDSRANEKKQIVDKLLGQGDSVDLTVLPIFGMGGMGKTTLAQLVYNDPAIKKHFQVQLWVCVSENFDVDFLAKRIVEEAENHGCPANGNTAPEKLQSALSGKRYLLVLDDVWNREENKWRKLKSYLQHGGTGSSVVTTTRDEYIAQFMKTIVETHKIEGLELNIIEEIIKTGAFSSQAQRHDDKLLKLVPAIAKRCSGSPLAATAFGSALRTKSTEEEWNAVLNRSKICDEENRTLPILKLSYNCLQPHMRQCFAFCAMFPKDHEIDVEMLIRLWMANSFIPEQQGVCLEVTGKQIFNELVQRSFFQEVKQVKYEVHRVLNMKVRSEEPGNSARTTCKIHDLMHDVAQDSMGKECAAVDTELKESKDFPYCARHLFLSVDIPGDVLNASRENRSLAIQTLICDDPRWRTLDVQHLSKHCKSVRALKTKQDLLLEPKYLHHLRYLDLSRSGIKALPEDITILYHLQTLNLSYCDELERLPKTMKYMPALRHLYTHGCQKLTSMPPDLGRLTSLQTLTSFVVGSTGSVCSNMGELKDLDLGGELELKQLENVTGADVKAANLGDKKRLEKLSLSWKKNNGDEEAHKEVLEGLRPHDGLKVLRIELYLSNAIPTWMLKLQDMVELELRGLKNLHCLFSGGAPSNFQKLKRMVLVDMPKFETWWDTTEVQGEQVAFPQLEKLEIRDCARLTTFPKAPKLSKVELEGCSQQASIEAASRYIASLFSLSLFASQDSDYNIEENSIQVVVRDRESPFPLADLRLIGCNLFMTHSSAPALWRCFGQLSRLEIVRCDVLVYWPENLFQGLVSLRTLEIWHCSKLTGHTKEEERVRGTLLPRLELLAIRWCESLGQVPILSSASLKMFRIEGCKSLEYVVFGGHQEETQLLVPSGEAGVVQQAQPAETLSSLIAAGPTPSRSTSSEDQSTLSTAVALKPVSSSSASSNHRRCFFPCLETLEIGHCEGLAKVAKLPPSIKTLRIYDCGRLDFTSLEKLHIDDCKSLESCLFNGTHQVYSSLRVLSVYSCPSIKQFLPSLLLQEQVELDSKPESMSDGACTAVALKKQSSSTSSNHCFFPCLESLDIHRCHGLTEVANLPTSIKSLGIEYCDNLVSLSWELPLLEELKIFNCQSLKSLPDGPHQAYSSLRVLKITNCSGIKQLPRSLQQRLDHLEKKDLDPHLLQVPTGRIASLMSKLECFGSRSRN